MGPPWIYVLFLARLSLVSAQEDLQGLTFVFPQDSVDSYVTLQSDQEEPFRNVTICLASFTDSLTPYALFSYATKGQDKDIFIYKRHLNEFARYEVYIGGEPTYFRILDSFLKWHRLCVFWASETGVLTFWLDGTALARKVVKKDYAIQANAFIMLGQVHPSHFRRQFSKGGFSGEIQEVYMWNTTVLNSVLGSVPWGDVYPPPVISWRNLKYEMKGNVALETAVGQ